MNGQRREAWARFEGQMIVIATVAAVIVVGEVTWLTVVVVTVIALLRLGWELRRRTQSEEVAR